MNTHTDIFSAAEAQLAELDAELKGLADKQRRRDDLAAWIAQGRRLLASPARHDAPHAGQVALDTSPAIEPARPVREGTKKAVIADAAAELIQAAGGPLPTRELVAGLQAKGVEVGGVDPIDTVSVVLNRSGGRFKSLGRKLGWILSDMAQKEETPQVAPTTAGS